MATLDGDDLAAIAALIEASASIHLIKQAVAGPRDHDNMTAQDRVLDDDESVLATFSIAEEITVDGANWTDATKYLVLAGAFAKYLWKTGDTITLTAGTGVTPGQYTIASKVDDDTIELAADINGASGDIGDGSIDGTITTGRNMRTVA